MPRLGSIVMAVAAATFTALLAPASAAATTWGVPGNGSNVCTVPNPNCDTIAQAVTAASGGDTIQLGAGAHAVAGTIALTKTLTFTGAGIGNTIVQPAPGVIAFSVRTNDIVFQDFTDARALVHGGFPRRRDAYGARCLVHADFQTRDIETGRIEPCRTCQRSRRAAVTCRERVAAAHGGDLEIQSDAGAVFALLVARRGEFRNVADKEIADM